MNNSFYKVCIILNTNKQIEATFITVEEVYKFFEVIVAQKQFYFLLNKIKEPENRLIVHDLLNKQDWSTESYNEFKIDGKVYTADWLDGSTYVKDIKVYKNNACVFIHPTISEGLLYSLKQYLIDSYKYKKTYKIATIFTSTMIKHAKVNVNADSEEEAKHLIQCMYDQGKIKFTKRYDILQSVESKVLSESTL